MLRTTVSTFVIDGSDNGKAARVHIGEVNASSPPVLDGWKREHHSVRLSDDRRTIWLTDVDRKVE